MPKTRLTNADYLCRLIFMKFAHAADSAHRAKDPETGDWLIVKWDNKTAAMPYSIYEILKFPEAEMPTTRLSIDESYELCIKWYIQSTSRKKKEAKK